MEEFPTLLEAARLRVLIVPVHPIRQETFKKYVDLLSQYSVVYLGDLTPQKQNNKLADQFFHGGHLYYHFTTSYNKEHAPLEDFQLHRQVMGVVGVMHCQQVADMAQGYQTFQQSLKRYPCALAHRCFAFEPLDSQVDDIKGPIMIPNVGQLAFYLSTMMADFSSELLKAFGQLANQIEKRSLISGPNMLMNTQNLSSIQAANSMVLAAASASPVNAQANAGTPAPMEPSSSSLGFGNLGGLLSSDKTKKRTPARAQKLIADLYLMAGRPEIAAPMYLSAIESMKSNTDYVWQAAALESQYAASLLMHIRSAGIGPKSPNSSASSSPRLLRDGDKPFSVGQVMLPPSSADIFIAAQESADVKNILCEIAERFREIVSLYDKVQPGQQGYYPIHQIAACLKMAKFLYLIRKHQFSGTIVGGPHFPFMAPETTVMLDIAASMGVGGGKANSSGANSGLPAGMDKDRIVANTIKGVTRPDIHSWITKSWSLGVEHLLPSDQIWVATHAASLYGLLGYKRKHAFYLRQVSILVLATIKAAPLAHRLSGISSISASLDKLASPSSPPAEHVGLALVTDGVPFPRTSANQGPSNKKRSNGALECMKRVCDVLGIGNKDYTGTVPLKFVTNHISIESDDEDDWLEDYLDETDLYSLEAVDLTRPLMKTKDSSALNLQTISGGRVHSSNGSHVTRHRMRYGWPALQIDVLKECIDIAESIDDHTHTVLYTARLLRRLHKHLTKEEQLQLFETLQSVVVKTRTRLDDTRNPSLDPQDSDEAPVLVKGITGGVMGVPVLRRLQPVRPTARKTLYRHSLAKLDSTEIPAVGGKDPFIYNPYAKEKKGMDQVLLVANEVAYFDVTLANPFSFDLDIQSITLRASGVEFQPFPSCTVIPAESRAHTLRLSGLPKCSGTLHIHGCIVRMFGGSVEEMIDPVQKMIMDPKRRTKDGKRRRQDDRERLGKRLAFLNKGKTQSNALGNSDPKLWSIAIQVISPQPIMKASLVSPANMGCMMLFEGEIVKFSMRLENIGNTPIDYAVISFAESYQSIESDGGSESPETAYERDIFEFGSRVLWKYEPNKVSPSGRIVSFQPFVERLDIQLAPGEYMDIDIGAFGKMNATGGTIKLEYGFINKDGLASQDQNEQEYFYTRHIFVPVLITVQSALSTMNMDILLFGSFERYITSKEAVSSPIEKLINWNEKSLSLEEMMVDPFGSTASEIEKVAKNKNKNYCLFTFDLKNDSNHPFEVVFEIYDNEQQPDKVSHSSSTVVHAGCIKRIMLPIKRIWLDATLTHKPVPIPEWKQFVVGKTQKFTQEEERLRRALFWYKEALVGDLYKKGRLIAKWNFSKNRLGYFSFRSMRLSKRMLHILKTEEISYEVSVTGSEAVQCLGESTFACRQDEIVNLEWKIYNRKNVAVTLILRVQPLQDHHNGNVGLDMKDRILFLGSLQNVLDPIEPIEGFTTFRLPILPLSEGNFEILYHSEVVGNPIKSSSLGENVYWGSEAISLFVT